MKTIKINSSTIAKLFEKKQKIGEDNKELIDEVTTIGEESKAARDILEKNQKRITEIQPSLDAIEQESMKYNQKIQEKIEEIHADDIGENEHYYNAEIKEDGIYMTVKSKDDYLKEYEEKLVARYFTQEELNDK